MDLASFLIARPPPYVLVTQLELLNTTSDWSYYKSKEYGKTLQENATKAELFSGKSDRIMICKPLILSRARPRLLRGQGRGILTCKFTIEAGLLFLPLEYERSFTFSSSTNSTACPSQIVLGGHTKSPKVSRSSSI